VVRGYETLLCVNIFSLIYYLGTDFCGFDLCPAATRNTVENLHKRTLRLSCSRLLRSRIGFSANEGLICGSFRATPKKTSNGMTCSLFFLASAFLNAFVQPRMTRPESLNRLNKHLIMGSLYVTRGPIVFAAYLVCYTSSPLPVSSLSAVVNDHFPMRTR